MNVLKRYQRWSLAAPPWPPISVLTRMPCWGTRDTPGSAAAPASSQYSHPCSWKCCVQQNWLARPSSCKKRWWGETAKLTLKYLKVFKRGNSIYAKCFKSTTCPTSIQRYIPSTTDTPLPATNRPLDVNSITGHVCVPQEPSVFLQVCMYVPVC